VTDGVAQAIRRRNLTDAEEHEIGKLIAGIEAQV
jgi:hypothetical protein